MSSGGRGNSYNGNRYPGRVPDTALRRRRMNIEDMLNPSDEGSNQDQRPESSESYQSGRTVSRNPSSLQGNRSSRSGLQSQGANASARSRGDSRSPNRGSGSGSPDVPSRTRASRPDYTNEQEHFIWYLRIDCGYSWTAIVDAFNDRFSHDGEGRREIPGLQCKFYRITGENGLPNVREMQRTRDRVQRYGMRAITGYTRERWSWLDGRHPPSTAYGHMLGDGRRG